MKGIDLVIIGDLAFDKIITGNQVKITIGGAAYNASIGAAAVSRKVGVVSRVGGDFPIEQLERYGIDVRGVFIIPDGKTPIFSFQQHPDGFCSYREERGVASEVYPELFPKEYRNAKYIHLASAPPQQHLIWLEALDKHINNKTVVSVDTFESFVEKSPDLTQSALQKADLVFTNEKEFNMLRQFIKISLSVPLVLKKGAYGAVYIDRKSVIVVRAPQVSLVNTTGAGDVLAGVFLALRASGISVKKALHKAVATASLSVTNFGVDHILRRNVK